MTSIGELGSDMTRPADQPTEAGNAPETGHTAADPHLQAIPTKHFTHVSVAANPYEILLAFGRVHQLIEPEGSLVAQAINWISICSLSPVTAKTLSRGLAQAVASYENRFGKIPDDPSVQIMPIEDEPDQNAPGR